MEILTIFGDYVNKFDRLYKCIIANNQTANISFNDFQYFVRHLGFSETNISGDHFTYKMDGILEKINLQPRGKDAKQYQVRQVRNIVLKYKLGGMNDEV